MKRYAALALTAALLSACGNNDPSIGLQPEELQGSAAPVAALDDLSGGVETAVELAPEFLAGLEALQLTPAVLGGAVLEGTRIAFPITGGEVTYYDPDDAVRPFVQGEVEHEGSGLRLTSASGTVVELTDFVVDPGESVLTGTVAVGGRVVAPSAPLFFLDGRTLEALDVDEAADTATLRGTTVTLTAEAAQALNGAFGTDALAESFPVGVAEIVLALPES